MTILCNTCVSVAAKCVIDTTTRFCQANIYTQVKTYFSTKNVAAAWFDSAGDSCHYGGIGLRTIVIDVVKQAVKQTQPDLVVHDNGTIQTLFNISSGVLKNGSATYSYAGYTEAQQASLLREVARPGSHLVVDTNSKTLQLRAPCSVDDMSRTLRILGEQSPDGIITYEKLAQTRLPYSTMKELVQNRNIVTSSGPTAMFNLWPLPAHDPAKMRAWLAYLNTATTN